MTWNIDQDLENADWIKDVNSPNTVVGRLHIDLSHRFDRTRHYGPFAIMTAAAWARIIRQVNNALTEDDLPKNLQSMLLQAEQDIAKH